MHPYAFYCLPDRKEISSILILVLYFILKKTYLETIGDIFRWSIPSTVFQLLLFSAEWQNYFFSKRQSEQGKGLARFPFLLFAVASSFHITVARITPWGRWIFIVPIPTLPIRLCLFLPTSWKCHVFHLIWCVVRTWPQVTFGGKVRVVDLKSSLSYPSISKVI